MIMLCPHLRLCIGVLLCMLWKKKCDLELIKWGFITTVLLLKYFTSTGIMWSANDV